MNWKIRVVSGVLRTQNYNDKETNNIKINTNTYFF